MNRFWKWTLGILGILIVLALLAIPFALHHRFGFSAGRGLDRWHGPMLRDHHGFGFDRFHAPMMHGRSVGHSGSIFSSSASTCPCLFYRLLQKLLNFSEETASKNQISSFVMHVR